MEFMPGDWDLSAFSIIPILFGAIPYNSLLVSMGLSKLATFLSSVRKSASSVSNSGSMENSIERCRTLNRNFCKAQTIYLFCQTENSKSCDKLKKAQQNLKEQTVHHLDQLRASQKWPPGSTPFYRGLLININNIISFLV